MSSANGSPDTDDPEVTLGIRLFMARRRKNFSQGDIAALTGYSRNTVSSYESDLSTPPLTFLKTVAAECEVRLEWLAGSEVEVVQLHPSRGRAAAFERRLDVTKAPVGQPIRRTRCFGTSCDSRRGKPLLPNLCNKRMNSGTYAQPTDCAA